MGTNFDKETRSVIMSLTVIPMAIASIIPIFVKAVPSWKQKYDEWSYSSSKKLKLSNNLYDKLKDALSDVKGQDVALETIVDSVCGWSESKNNKFGNKSGGLIIHMAGVSGTGKTMCADILTNELSEKSAIKISYSSIDTQNSKSSAEQLFGSYTRKSSFNTDVKCNTKYAAQLIHNPEVIVQIDEFDKFMMRDDSLQSLLWDVADSGRLKIDKDTYVDCSNTIFILTSNASRESLKMKIDKTKNDDSDSLESVNFKQAFLNRITSVYFENFSGKIYEEILREKLEPIEKYYSKEYNIRLHFSNDCINNIVNELLNMKTGGARNIGIFTRKLYAFVNAFKRENNIDKNCNETVFDLDISYGNGKFSISQK